MMAFLSKILNFSNSNKVEIYQDSGEDWYVVPVDNRTYDLFHELKRYRNEKLIEHKMLYIATFSGIDSLYEICNTISLLRLEDKNAVSYIQEHAIKYSENIENYSFDIANIAVKIWAYIPYTFDYSLLKYDWVCDFLKHPEFLTLDYTNHKCKYTSMRYVWNKSAVLFLEKQISNRWDYD